MEGLGEGKGQWRERRQGERKGTAEWGGGGACRGAERVLGDSETRGGRWGTEKVCGSFEGAERGPRSTVREGD